MGAHLDAHGLCAIGMCAKLGFLMNTTVTSAGRSDRGQSPRVPRLHCVFAAGRILNPVATFVLGQGQTVIGRDRAAGVSLDDMSVSREHAIIDRRAEGDLAVTSRPSKNGTYVEGSRLPDGAARPLRDGDVLRLGGALLVVRIDELGAPEADGHALQGIAPSIATLRKNIDRLADKSATVLILGETGSGKELVARALHQRSSRSGCPFVPVNCAAVPDSTAANELFGHEAGAYTDAKRAEKGKIRTAEKGTLFLDEIGEASERLQEMLLRVLQESEVQPLGQTRTEKVNVRFVAATNRDLARAVRAGSFREDLYYRLAGFELRVPPLRERREDILRLLKERQGQSLPLNELDVEELLLYSWPGNVRELHQRGEQLRVFGADQRFHDRLRSGAPTPAEPGAATGDDDDDERRGLELALERSGGNISAAARESRKSLDQMKRALRRLNVDPNRFRRRGQSTGSGTAAGRSSRGG